MSTPLEPAERAAGSGAPASRRSRRRLSAGRAMLQAMLLACAVLLGAPVLADKPIVQDSTVAERDVQILEAMLIGVFANGNQMTFEPRLKVPEADRAPRLEVKVTSIDAGEVGERVVLARAYRDRQTDAPTWAQVWALTPDSEAGQVRAAVYDVSEMVQAGMQAEPATDFARWSPSTDAARCDLVFTRDAGQFTGRSEGDDCAAAFDEVQVAPEALWLSPAGAAPRLALRRARLFQCHLDVPGISGGRQFPFNRYTATDVHDQGGMAVFGTKDAEGRDLGVVLQNVAWPINNEVGSFTRDSFVVYLFDREAEKAEVAYAFTQPDAERLGFNLFEMLLYCYMTPNNQAKPEF